MLPTQTPEQARTAPGCPSTGRHGTLAAYHSRPRCRCPGAIAANSRDSKRRKWETANGISRTWPATGTIRRIQALMAIGWRKQDIAGRLGCTVQNLDRIVRSNRVRTATAARVGALYAAWSGTPGPSRFTRGHARSLGYPPPLAWPDGTIDDPGAEPLTDDGPAQADPLVVEWLLRGGDVPDPLPEVDARAFCAAAADAGWSSRDIAARAGLDVGLVRRWRSVAVSGEPAERACLGCGGPIPFDASADVPWRYRQRNYHPGVCRERARHSPAAARQAVAS